MNKHYSFLFLLLITFFCSAAKALELSTDVKKSPNDDREYGYLTLQNGLKVFLISDDETDKAAASLDIKVGSANDPTSLPGLAHFLEHMLFLGTEKYPEPDAYQKFISEHGGGHNAYTALENTNYFFDINADYLEPALDRFAQQFTAPLFNEEYVQREVNAVHSEYSSKIQDDGRRYLEALKTTLNPKHPYRNFAVGNLSTLVDTKEKTLREALLEFYAAEYSADRMRLTVLGKENLQTLAKWVEARFSSIKNKNLGVEPISTPFFSGGFLPAKLEVESIMDTRTLSVAFPIPSTLEHLHSQPMGYLANLIGHEGKGSLLSALKNLELADTLSAGTQFDTGEHGMFIVTMTLTPKGIKNTDDILQLLFSYIELLKREGIQKLYFEEQAKLAKIGFKFKEKAPALSYVRSLSASLHELEPNEVLSAYQELNDFNPKLIEDFLTYLKPENILVSLRAQSVKTEQETTWYSAPYSLQPLSVSLVNRLKKAQLDPNLALPAPNTFIPDDTELVDADNHRIPISIEAQNGIEVWHQTTTEFGTPKATFYLSVRSPNSMNKVENVVMTQLLVSMLVDNLVEFAYPAYLAGLSYDLYKHVRGITLKISGYNDKQEVLLDTILGKISESQFQEDRFNNIKERLERSLENQKDRRPFQQTIEGVHQNILIPSWSNDEQLEALGQVSFEDLKTFKQLFFSTIDTAVLSSGNVEVEQTEQMAKLVSKHLLSDANIEKVERAKVRRLDGPQNWIDQLEIEHPDTSLVLYMQGQTKSFAERALYSLLAQAVGNDYYAQLRTEKQLGYIVFASPFPMLEVPGVAFVVQSPNTAAKAIYAETKNFLTEQIAVIEALDEETYARYQKAIISRLEEKDTNIGQVSNRNWSEIDRQNYDFNSREEMIEAVNQTSLDEFIAFYKRRIEMSGADLIVFSQGENAELASQSESGGEDSTFKPLIDNSERLEALGYFK